MLNDGLLVVARVTFWKRVGVQRLGSVQVDRASILIAGILLGSLEDRVYRFVRATSLLRNVGHGHLEVFQGSDDGLLRSREFLGLATFPSTLLALRPLAALPVASSRSAQPVKSIVSRFGQSDFRRAFALPNLKFYPE